MDPIIIGMLGLTLAETSYLTYSSIKNNVVSSKNSVLLDTSVLIDGRIVAIARSGLMSSRLIVPRSVVRELQFMADKADHDKRERARFGLDVIDELQQLPGMDVEVRDDGITSEHGVDEQLIVLARRYGAKLCTIDYNLNKAARVQDIEVININEMAHALRVVHLPGEKIAVELVQPGQEKKQAVGYLDDGTMVVVDDSRDQMGTTVDVELTRVLQTAAGRMMFARLQNAPAPRRRAPQPKTENRQSSSRDTTNRDRKPATTTPVAPRPATGASQQPVAPRPAGQHRNNNSRRRKRTPEDTLVDLANT